jgi:carbon-monoxide dehydrogenase large subunit
MNARGHRFIGQSLPRKEDRRLLRGVGQFIADIVLPRMLHVAFLRSGTPHARIEAIDVSRALSLPGVVDILTGADVRGFLAPVPGMQNRPPKQWREAVEHSIDIPDQPVLAVDKIRHVGEGIAVVIAESRHVAEDAVQLIDVRVADIESIGGIDDALREGAPKVHDHLPSNTVAKFRVRKGDAEAVLAAAPHRLQYRFHNHRYLGLPIECRGVLAEYDARRDAITIYSSTQVVHWVCREVAKRLNLPESRVRCVAPDVGGGFGVKGHVYPEDILIPFLARRLQRPVCWIEDRREHLVNSAHARDDRHDVEIGVDSEGRILAIRDQFVKDSGAYTPVGIGAPSNTIAHMMGPYRILHFDATAQIVVTNKTPNAPYRGSGRPEGVFVMERVMDLVAHHLGIDAADVRRRNMIPAEAMPFTSGVPYRDGSPVVYDGGDYPAAFEKALFALGGLRQIRERQRAAWDEGRYVGLGLGSYVEGTGAGPFEGATVRVEPSGTLYVATGACAQGQGHETVFAQITADEWGIAPNDVHVVVSDTGAIALGYGTIASRSAVNSSAAIRRASGVLRQKVFAIAAHILGTHTQDLELRDGRVFGRNHSNISLSLKEIAAASMPGWDNNRPQGITGGLEVTEYFEPPTVTWSYATHAALVEIDMRVFVPKIRNYVVVHDAGVLINPKLAEGQVLGGVCQGIGGGLFEEVVYGGDGQLLTGSLIDYLVPTASDLPPSIQVLHTETPSTLNELGIKGLGEGGAIAPPVVVANAVCDALRPFGIELFATPIRPSDILQEIRKREAIVPLPW